MVAYFFSPHIIDFLIAPLRKFHPVDLVFQRPYEAFFTHIKAAGITGFVIACPILFTELWLFLKPGLYQHEKRILFSLSLCSVLFFVAGAAFAYWVAIPFGLDFLLSYQTESLKPFIGIEAYFSFLIGMILAFGLLFDFPILILGLVKLNIVKSERIAKSRKVIIVVIFIVAAVLTPSPDPISQLILALPLWVLFEISLIAAKVMEKMNTGPNRVTPK